MSNVLQDSVRMTVDPAIEGPARTSRVVMDFVEDPFKEIPLGKYPSDEAVVDFRSFWVDPQMINDAADDKRRSELAAGVDDRHNFIRDHVAAAGGYQQPDEFMRECAEAQKSETRWGHRYQFQGACSTVKMFKHGRCENPMLMRCKDCDHHLMVVCDTKSPEVCAGCSEQNKKNVRTLAREPILPAKKGTVLLVTFTAPGLKGRHCLVHEYRTRKGKVIPDYKCEEKGRTDCKWCPCGEDDRRIDSYEKAAKFNSSAGRMWNDVITDVRRSIEVFDGCEYFKVFEPQTRPGYHAVLHAHAIIRLARAPRPGSREFVKQLQEIAVRIGWGHEVDVQVLDSEKDIVRGARYVAKYVTKNYEGFEVPFERFVPGYIQKSQKRIEKRNAELDVIKRKFWKRAVGDERPWFGDEARPVMRRPKARAAKPRMWTASAKWGFTMKWLKFQQQTFAAGNVATAKQMMTEKLEVVRIQQSDPPDRAE